MTRIFFYLGLSLTFMGARAGATSQELAAQGNQIVVKATGCPVYLKGVNVASLEYTNAGQGPPSYNSGAVIQTVQEAVNAWNCNIVRIPLNQDRWLGMACSCTAGTQQPYVDAIVNWCEANNVYVMLDLHWSDHGVWWGSNVCSSGQQEMPDDHSTLFWADVAARYGNRPGVIFDLYNEPKNYSDWYGWRNGGSSHNDGTYHSPGLQGLLATIRSTTSTVDGNNAKNMVVAGGLNWAFDLSGIPSYALSDTTPSVAVAGDGVVYATHIYPWKGSPYPTLCDQAGGCLDGAVPPSTRNVYPVMVTEFGQYVSTDTTHNQGVTPPDNSWSLTVTTWARANLDGFIAWDMNPGSGPSLISNWSFTPTTFFGNTVATALASTSGGCAGTPTPSFTPSPTITVSPTITQTPSISPTFSVSPSFSASPTITPTFTVTPTATQDLGGPLVVEKLVGVPNPNPRLVKVLMEGPGDELELSLYSQAYVRVRPAYHAGPVFKGWNTAMVAPLDLGLPPGVYYLVGRVSLRGSWSDYARTRIVILP